MPLVMGTRTQNQIQSPIPPPIRTGIGALILLAVRLKDRLRVLRNLRLKVRVGKEILATQMRIARAAKAQSRNENLMERYCSMPLEA
jgi:hypothetical protein